jgi:hypothetical protein
LAGPEFFAYLQQCHAEKAEAGVGCAMRSAEIPKVAEETE